MLDVLPAESLGHEEFDRLALHFFPAIAEHFFHLAVHQDNRSIGVDDDNTVGSRLEEAPERFFRPRGSRKARPLAGFGRHFSGAFEGACFSGTKGGLDLAAAVRGRKAKSFSIVSACSYVRASSAEPSPA